MHLWLRSLLHLSGGLWSFAWPFISLGAATAVPALATLLLAAFLAARPLPLLPGLKGLYDALCSEDETATGPILYGIAIVLVTWLFRDHEAVGAGAVAALAWGDGAADWFGKRYGRRFYRLPWAKKKSMEGSAAMFCASVAGILLFSALFGVSVRAAFLPAVIASFLGTVAEAASPHSTDNLTVPLVTSVALYWLLPS